MVLLLYVQLQVGLQANVPQPSEYDEYGGGGDATDDVEAALTDLQVGMMFQNFVPFLFAK